MTELFTFQNNDIFMNNIESDLYKNKIQKEIFKDLFDNSLTGGIGSNKDSRLKIMPSFINVLRGRILYNGKTKMSLSKIKPKNNSSVILGTIIDLAKVKDVLGAKTLTEESIKEFVDMYDYLPLMYDSDENNSLVKNNRKKFFFNNNSKLCLVRFNVTGKNEYYVEVPSEDVSVEFKDIKDVVKEKNYIVSHYIYERFFFLVPTNKISINSIKFIDITDGKVTFTQPTKKFTYKENGEKIDLITLEQIISSSKTMFDKFV